MINEAKLREKLAVLLKRAEFHSLSTGAYEPLIEQVITAVEECEVAEEPNTLTTATRKKAAVKTQAQQ